MASRAIDNKSFTKNQIKSRTKAIWPTGVIKKNMAGRGEDFSIPKAEPHETPQQTENHLLTEVLNQSHNLEQIKPQETTQQFEKSEAKTASQICDSYSDAVHKLPESYKDDLRNTLDFYKSQAKDPQIAAFFSSVETGLGLVKH